MTRASRSRARLVGPLCVVLAVVAGGLVPLALDAGGATSLTAAHPAVATCSAPTSTTSSPCTPSLTVSPSTELADGQLVTVTGTGFTPNDSVGMAECKAVAGSTSESNCDLDTVDFAFTDASGDFTIGYNVTRILNVNGGNVDCAVSLCLLGAADESDYSVAASAALEFNPDIPPELSGTVSPTGGVNTKTGTAFLSGTVHCVAAAQVQVDVELSQIYHRRFNFTNEVYRFVNCKPRRKGTAWKVRVPPGDGLYGKGKATAVAQFSAPIGNSLRNYTATATVVLSPTTETK